MSDEIRELTNQLIRELEYEDNRVKYEVVEHIAQGKQFDTDKYSYYTTRIEYRCDNCDYLSCALRNNTAFCDECANKDDCDIKTQCLNGYDIECDNGFELESILDDEQEDNK